MSRIHGLLRRFRSTGLLLGILAFAAPVAAQPMAGPAAALPSAATPSGDAGSPRHDPDPAKLRASFNRGLELLRAGHAAEAAQVLEDVAAQSRLPERQRAAASVALYARRLEALAAIDPRAASELSDGRTQFIVTSTLIGFYSGIVLLDIFDVDDIRPSVATLIATTSLGLVGSLYGSRGAGIREVDADAYTLGATWGGLTMLSAAGALDVDDSEVVQGMALAGLVGGAFAGMGLSRQTNPTRGQVALTQTTMLLGGASALLSTAILSERNLQFRTHATLWLAGLQIGTGAGLMLAPDLDWSPSRARLTLLGGALGALAGWGTAALITGDSDDNLAQIWAGSALVGMWGGFALTTWLTEGMAPDPGFARSRDAVLLPTVIGRSPGLALVGRF